MTPRCGVRVVNGHASTRGVAADSRRTSDDLPAEGKPTSPTSAMRRSSRRSIDSSTFSPRSANDGHAPEAVRERAVPPPTTATGGDDDAAAGVERSASAAPSDVAHDRPERDADDAVLAARAGPALAAPVPAAAGPEVRRTVEVDERGHVRVGDEHDRAALAAVTTVRTAERHVGLAAERDHPEPPSPARTCTVHSSTNEAAFTVAPQCRVAADGSLGKCDGRPAGRPDAVKPDGSGLRRLDARERAVLRACGS
jgi:hypothetical protein